MNLECGSATKTRVDRKMFDHGTMKTMDVAANCNAVVLALESLCDDEAVKTP